MSSGWKGERNFVRNYEEKVITKKGKIQKLFRAALKRIESKIRIDSVRLIQ